MHCHKSSKLKKKWCKNISVTKVTVQQMQINADKNPNLTFYISKSKTGSDLNHVLFKSFFK